jgi:putative transposase
MPAAALRYNRYHPTLIHCYAVGREYLVPEHVRKLVPCSTASGWRKVDTEALIGHEVWNAQREALDLHELFLRYERLRTAVLTLVKVWASVADILHPILAHKEHSERIVNAMQLLFTIMPRERVFRLADISSSAFHDRLSRNKVRCGLSPAERCFKRHPLQLALREVEAIKALFADPDLVCWPSVSLYYEGLRNRGLHMALSTFYKYTVMLGFKRKPRKRTAKTIGLRATRPNEYLHVDTTHHELEHGVMASIVFVSDNFSKAILGWRVALGKHATNVVEALHDTVDTIRQHHPEQTCAVLVADGGSENHAVCVEELLRDTFPPYITKVIALKDIRFSNSPIEAINKIYKQYLRHYQPKTPAALLQVTEAFVHDYSTLRPHGSLKGLIPMEAYTRPELKLDFRQTLREARVQRIAENKQINCSLCISKQP